MPKPAPWCQDCLEVTLSQRQCPHCGGETREGVAELPGAPGGEGNAGPGPHHGWHCVVCHALWDGGRRYGFACLAHGGHEPEGPEPRAMITPGQPLGDYPGKN